MENSIPKLMTSSDRAAQAKAYGLSYGQLMGKLYVGEPLPALQHKIRWTRGSHHRGE